MPPWWWMADYDMNIYEINFGFCTRKPTASVNFMQMYLDELAVASKCLKKLPRKITSCALEDAI